MIMSPEEVDGKSTNGEDDHWIVSCPNCEKEIEYTGYFDAEELNKCSCGAKFKTERVYFEDGSYIY